MIVLVAFFMLDIGKMVFSAPSKNVEYDIKAAFIHKFVNFIEWPDSYQMNTMGICVIGDNPFGERLSKKSINESEKNPILINYIGSFKKYKNNDFNKCKIVFISSSEKKEIDEIISIAKDHNVLTIGDTKGYAEKGVLINFYLEQNKVRFEINIDVMKVMDIKISSKLLRLSRIVSSTMGINQIDETNKLQRSLIQGVAGVVNFENVFQECQITSEIGRKSVNPYPLFYPGY